MRKAWLVPSLAFCAALAVAWLVTLAALAAESTPDRPPGITAEKWLPLSDSVGLALEYVPSIKDTGAVARPLQGQLMAKVGGKWVVVEMSESSGLQWLPAK